MKARNLDLSLVSTTEPEWFHVLDEISEAVKFKLKSISGNNTNRIWDVFERTEAGFCYKGQCFGARASDAFEEFAKRQNAQFTINIKVEF